MPAVERLHRLAQTLAHRLGRARDHIALIDEVLPLQAFTAHRSLIADLAKNSGLDRLHRAIARRVGEAVINVEASVVEVVHVRRVVLLRLLVGLRHGDDLREAEAVRIQLLALLRHHFPVAVGNLLARDVSEVRKEAVLVIVIGAEVVGLDRSAAGNPNRRMRLLQRLRPQVHVTQLGVLAVEREHVFGLPGLDDQIVSLVILLANRRGNFAVAEVGIHRGSDREARDQPSARNHVEHREFLGDANRRIVKRYRIPEHHQVGVARAPREGGRHDIRRRHQAVCILMMLVDAEPVEAHRVGVFQLIEVVVVEAMTDFRIVQIARDIDPHAVILLFEIFRQEPIRHQMEPGKFHNSFSFGSPLSRARVHAVGCAPTCSKFVSPLIRLFPSSCEGEDEGEGPI